MQRSRTEVPVLDLRPPVRLDALAITLAGAIVVDTVVPPLAPMLVMASAIVCVGALLWRNLVPAEWRLMAMLGPLFVMGGVGISSLHAAAPDPLAELAAFEPGEVFIVGTWRRRRCRAAGDTGPTSGSSTSGTGAGRFCVAGASRSSPVT